MTTAAVLFDLDDTLFDHRHCTRAGLSMLRSQHACLAARSLEDLEAAHSQILERLHVEVLAGRLPVDEARVLRFRTLFLESGEKVSDSVAVAVAQSYRDAYLTSWRLVDGALPLVCALRERARIGIVTNNIVSEQERKVDALGLAPHVDALVISEAVGVTKPDPRIFEMALARLSAGPAEAVMVGDSWPSDIVGARRAGLRAVWFNPLRRPRPDDGAADVAELTSLSPSELAAAQILGG